MKASIAHKVRPSTLILKKNSRKPWGRWDIVLSKAYQRFVNELCVQCGLPKYICHNDDNRIQFKVSRDECASSAMAEKAQEELSKKEFKSYGIRVFGEPFMTIDAIEEGLELSDFRKPYFIEVAKKRGLIPEDDVT